MSVGFGPITNGQVTNTGQVIRRWLNDPACTEFAIASAYVTLSGLRALQPDLTRAFTRGNMHVRFLTGIKDCFTEVESLEYLLRLANRFPERLTVRLSRNPRFHAKCFLFKVDSLSKVIVGSANLTSGGMTVDGELSIQIETDRENPSASRLWRWFEREFRNATTLDEKLLGAYREAWFDCRPKKPISTGARKRLLELLRPTKPANLSGNVATNRQWWLTTIEGSLSTRSMAMLADTRWYQRNEPELICYPEKPSAFDRVAKGDKLVVLDTTRGKRRSWMRLATVQNVHDYPRTPDGSFFLVLKYNRRGKKKLSRDFVRGLIEQGVFETSKIFDKLRLKQLNDHKVAKLSQVLKPKVRS